MRPGMASLLANLVMSSNLSRLVTWLVLFRHVA